jgi:acetoin utilization deacetylase AcuC-like enzyme
VRCGAPGTGPEEYLSRFSSEVVPAVEQFAPGLVIVSCGFDAHRDDPLASLELESSTYGLLAGLLVESCGRLGLPRPLVVLEGGYALGALRDSAAAVASALTS